MTFAFPRRLALAALIGALLVPFAPGGPPAGVGPAAAEWIPEDTPPSSRFT